MEFWTPSYLIALDYCIQKSRTTILRSCHPQLNYSGGTIGWPWQHPMGYVDVPVALLGTIRVFNCQFRRLLLYQLGRNWDSPSTICTCGAQSLSHFHVLVILFISARLLQVRCRHRQSLFNNDGQSIRLWDTSPTTSRPQFIWNRTCYDFLTAHTSYFWNDRSTGHRCVHLTARICTECLNNACCTYVALLPESQLRITCRMPRALTQTANRVNQLSINSSSSSRAWEFGSVYSYYYTPTKFTSGQCVCSSGQN